MRFENKIESDISIQFLQGENLTKIPSRKYYTPTGGYHVRLYHGSENIIKVPVYGYGNVKNDYGLGFYCTQDKSLAMEWAVDMDRDGYANAYEFDEEGLDILNLGDGNFSALNWIAILLDNRDFQINAPIAVEAKKYLLEKYLPSYENVDIMRGYRADDSYFAFARDFINNTISLEQLSEAMHYGNLGEQIALMSKRAIERIEFVGSEVADSKVWYPKKETRDRMARSRYFNLDKRSFRRGETYIIKIIEEEM